ncbi:TolC family protein [Xylanibacter brevis]|uniref:TolC family protein n=1 Tax=Xylanibacter brevis TaxID=83231 RepID=UPI000486524B|nr:TolC family protein [Xylanibacter brevis]
MKKRLALGLCLLTLGAATAGAQQLLSLDSCRAMALRNNKQMNVQQLKQDVAENLRKSARTKYLPHVAAIGTYQYTSREVSLLNDDQKSTFPKLGTAAGQRMEQVVPGASSAPAISTLLGVLDATGQRIVDALETDSRNIFAGSVMLTQPVFMGGSIVAMNKMARINQDMAEHTQDATRQLTLYETDKTYWLVVSLRHKQRLAESYLEVVKKLDDDVQKMIAEGVATRSDGLSVSVKVSEAEMNLQRVNDGLVLAKMLLCQQIGLPSDSKITLVDENADSLAEVTPALAADDDDARAAAMENRPELRLLESAVDLSRQSTNLLRAGNLPQVLLTGGYVVSNPNLLNGFEKKFGGMWNVGVMVRVPIWNWGDVNYKVRASKGATAIANLELEEAREKIELQVNQTNFKVDEANKRQAMAEASIKRAEENLRTAEIGFREGVITPTTVMEAQTAWLQAKSQKIDADIDVKMAQVDLQKAMGQLK